MKERNNVNKIREGHLMSKMELARLAGVSSATIDRIEHGETCRKGNILETCAILTTTANRLMAPLHDRMPVLLHPTEFELWLDRSMNNPEKLQRLYQSYPAELLQEREVSSIVNSASHETPETIVPLQAPH